MKQTSAITRLKKFSPLPNLCSNKSLNCKQKKHLLKNLDRQQLLFLLECCINIQRKNLPLNSACVSQLSKYKNHFKYLNNPINSIKKKTDYIQKGGFLNILLPILSVAIPAILDAFKQRQKQQQQEQ